MITDPELVKGIALQAQALVPEKLGLKPPPIEFVIVDDLGLFAAVQAAGQDNEAIQAILAKEATNFTALTTPGGAVVLGLSVLKTVKNYDELDFLLAHERSHVLFDHFSEDERKEKLTKLLGIGILIASLATRGSDADTRDTVAWSALGLIVANGLLGPAWDRAQEREADELGYELLMESDKSADGAVNILERFKKRDEALQAYMDVMCGPDSAGERFLKNLFGSIFGIRIPEKGYDPTNPVCEERRNLFASLFRDHPDIDERKEIIEKHDKKFYKDRPPISLRPIGDGNATLIDFFSPNGDTARSVKAYDGITAYHRKDLATARQIAQSIPSKGKDETLLPVLELQFYVANADGKRAEALQYLEWATLAPEPSERHSKMAENEYVKDQRWGDAARIIERRMLRQIGNRDALLPLLITYLRLAGNLGKMEKVLAECKALERPGMTLACEAAAHPRKPEEVAPAPAPSPEAPRPTPTP